MQDAIQAIRDAITNALPTRRHLEGRAGCYLIHNFVSSRVYIGQSADIAKRLGQHLVAMKVGEHPSKTMVDDYRTHGPSSFAYALIVDCPDESRRLGLERQLIEAAAVLDRYNTIVYESLTDAERQAVFRARKAATGLTQLGGIYAHPEDHAEIRAEAARLAALRGLVTTA